jgi:hypothetical protein
MLLTTPREIREMAIAAGRRLLLRKGSEMMAAKMAKWKIRKKRGGPQRRCANNTQRCVLSENRDVSSYTKNPRGGGMVNDIADGGD